MGNEGRTIPLFFILQFPFYISKTGMKKIKGLKTSC